MAFKTFYKSPTCEVLHLGPLVVMRLAAAAEIADLDQVDACCDLVTGEFKKMVQITAISGQTPSPGTMERAAQLTRKFEQVRLATVMILKGSGLQAVVSRKILGAFTARLTEKTDIVTFNDFHDGVVAANQLLVPLGTAVDQTAIEALVKHLNTPF